MSMKNKRAYTSMITSPYNATVFSSHVVTITDQSQTPEPEVNTDNYSVLQPVFLRKGITNENVTIEGNDILNKLVKLFGKPNTVEYGPMATYAYRAAQSGFNVITCNLRTDDCTYPNFYVEVFGEKAKVVENGVASNNPYKQKIYMAKVAGQEKDFNNGWYFAMNEDDLKKQLPKNYDYDGGTKAECVLENVYDVGFRAKTITNLTEKTDFEGFLSIVKDGKKHSWVGSVDMEGLMYPAKKEPQSAEDKRAGKPRVLTEVANTPYFEYPVFGAAYRGADDWGNRYRFKLSYEQNKINNRYPLFRCSISESESQPEFQFDFCLFSKGENSYNYSWRERVMEECKVVFTATNHVNLFEPFMHTRRNANLIEEDMAALVAKAKEEVMNAVKGMAGGDKPDLEFAGATDENATGGSKVRWEAFFGQIDMKLGDVFKRTTHPEYRSAETPLSMVDIFSFTETYMDENGKFVYRDLEIPGFRLHSCPQVIDLKSGSLGPAMHSEVERGEFDMYAFVNMETGDTIEDKNDASGTFLWVDLLTKYYKGEIDPSLFDQSIVKDAILFGEGYPEELQEVIAELVRYHENVVHKEGTRVDFTYIRTPEVNKVRTASEGIAWSRRFIGSDKDVQNANMHPSIGSFIFNDPSTNSQERFSGWYEYLGLNGSLFRYLISGTSDMFASGDHSVVFGASPGTELAIPISSIDKTNLVENCVMYYGRRSNGRYALAEDLSYLKKVNSPFKNVGSSIHFNRMMNAMSCYMLDNRIVNTDRDTLERLKKDLEKVAAQGARHFKGNFSINVKTSVDINEVGRDVVLVECSVTGNNFSRRNRLNMIKLKES